MQRTLLTLFLLIVLTALSGQTTADLENYALDPESYRNDSGGEGGFRSGNVFLPNTFEVIDGFAFWSGWSLSTLTDTETPGFGNQFSAITGEGVDGSSTYAIAFAADSAVIRLEDEAVGGLVQGMYVTNSTYAFLSMRDGDAFAKRFGGETGDDPDFFRLTIKAYYEGELSSDSVEVYLADYRFEDNTQDYILDEWAYVELGGLGPADSLRLTLESSDVGDFGMNTPGYFCADNLITADGLVLSAKSPKIGPPLEVFPNPASEFVRVRWPESREALLQLTDMTGRAWRSFRLRPGMNEIALDGLSAGIYVASLRYAGTRRSKRLVVR